MVETESIVPGSKNIVIENGGDHARNWAVSEKRKPTWIVTFGHHNNKRPELVIEAFANIDPELRPDSLVILGARGTYAESLESLATSFGISECVLLPGFVEEVEYHRFVAGAEIVVLASSDEGFGLPVAEADYFGIPAVVTSDSGMESIFSGLYVAEPSAIGLGSQLTRALKDARSGRIFAKRTLGTWSDTVSKIRVLITQ